MSLEQLRNRIAALTALDAPVGFEEPVLRAACEELSSSCKEVSVDLRGNLYAWHAGNSREGALTVMITAHADEIGFMITSILPGGFLRFDKLGHPTDMVLPGQRVRVLTGSGPLEGVIGVKPGHVLSPQEARQVPSVSQMYIDIGARSREEAQEWGVEPGSPAVFVGELTATRNVNRLFGKCVDNRMGVACVLEIASQLKEVELDCRCAYVIAVEEEIGLRGAAVATPAVNPDVVIAIDTVPSGGTPDLTADALPWEIGAGPLLKVRESRGLSTHGPLRNLIRLTAEEKNIPYQLIVDTAGVTDATSAQQASGRIAAAVIGLARRYSHSAVEMFDLTDVQGIIDLVSATVPQLKSRDQLRRI